MRNVFVAAAVAAVAVLATDDVYSQDARASPPLPPFPQVYDTADLKIRVVQAAGGLSNPWSMAW